MTETILEEAIINIKETVQGYIKASEEDSLAVPEEKFKAFSAIRQILRNDPAVIIAL